MRSDPWSEAFAVHGSAVASFAAAAEAVEPSAWHVPRAEGKWSPALVTGHLIRTYDVLIAEVGGGAGMRIRLPAWKRLFLRLTLMPRLLRGGAFPRRVPAPPEIRPTEAPPDPASGAALFRQRAQEFETAVRNARARKPPARITHAYFGPASLPKAVLFCARHIQHHQAQLGVNAAASPYT
ncbi:MAG: DinB family protein [Acidobacteriota bacterium]